MQHIAKSLNFKLNISEPPNGERWGDLVKVSFFKFCPNFKFFFNFYTIFHMKCSIQMFSCSLILQLSCYLVRGYMNSCIIKQFLNLWDKRRPCSEVSMSQKKAVKLLQYKSVLQIRILLRYIFDVEQNK